ncbi:MAG: hypothetical protein MUE30_05930 [Spirosomaceae bacterium]|jgi:hypothetical protein|nr:hypothetical protein [Spirosomataceae bacterium]
MKNLKVITTICALAFTTSLYAQMLSVKDKTVKIEDLPEYVIINCDNVTTALSSSINIAIHTKNSKYEQPLKELEDLLEGNKYLNIRNQTDLLNVMSELGFEYVNAFPQNAGVQSIFSRSGFVFRKKGQLVK